MAKEDTKPYSARALGPFPIHRGPFVFGPHILSRAEWSITFQTLIKQVLAQANITGQVFCPSGDRLARIEFKTAEMIADGDGGMFAVNERGDWLTDDDMSHWSGPFGPPKQFFRELDEPENVTRLGPDYQNVRDFALLLYRYMEIRFQRALEEGIAQITGCVERPPAPSIPIPFQQMPYLHLVERDSPDDFYLIEDLQLDEAVTKGGARVYCLGVVPVRGAAVAALSVKRRGPKRVHDEAAIDSTIIELLHQKGLPSRAQRWTQSRLIEAVVARLGPNGPRKSTVEKRIAPSIFKKHLAGNDFQQSTK